MTKQQSAAQLAALKRNQFKPGQSGNPGGRSPRRSLTSAMLGLLEQHYPGDRDGKTWAKKVAQVLLERAVAGDVAAIKLVADRAEGRVTEQIAIRGGADFEGFFSLRNLTDEELNEHWERCNEVLRRTAKSRAGCT